MEFFMKDSTYINVTQKMRALIKELVQLGPNDEPKFQEQLKNYTQLKSKRTHNKHLYHCPKNIYRKLQMSN